MDQNDIPLLAAGETDTQSPHHIPIQEAQNEAPEPPPSITVLLRTLYAWVSAAAALLTTLILFGSSKADSHKDCSSRTNGPTIIGDMDIYGLGLRLSLYIQWLSSVVASSMGPDLANEIMISSLLFYFPLTVALYVMILEARCLFTVDVVVVTQMLHGGIYLSIPISFWDLVRGVSTPTTIVSATLFVLMAPALMWNWVIFARFGPGNYAPSPGNFGFIFSRHAGAGPWRGPAWAVVVFQSWMLIHPIVFMVVQFLRNADPRWFPGPRRSEARSPIHKTLILFFGPAVTAFTVASIELSLQWNQVEGINRVDLPGQLIPLLGTVGAIIWTFRHTWRQWWRNLVDPVGSV